MALREELWPWDSQPQELVQLKADHPLAPFCIGGWVSSQAGVLMRVGVVQAITRSGTTQSYNAQGAGTAFGAYAGSGIINLPNTSEQRLTGVNGSIAVGVTLGALTSSEYHYIWAVRDGTTHAASLNLASDGATYSGGRVNISIAGVDAIGTSGSAQQNAYAVYSAQWGANGRRLYVNGELDSTSAGTQTIASSSIQPSLGNRQTGGRSLGTQNLLHWWFGFSINIGDEWHAELARDPYQLIEPLRIPVPVSAGGGDVTTSLSGQAATASAGTLANSRTVAASGQAATASAGTVAPSRTNALSGQAATASAGTVTQSKTRALSGQSVTASAGTLDDTRTVSLSGQAATASAGTVTYTADGNVTLALSGQAVAASAGTLAPSRSVAFSGQAATASAGTAVAGRSIAATGTQITTAAGTLTLGIVVPLAGQAAAAGAGTVTYSTAGAVVVALTGQAVEASAGTIGYAAQILSAAPIGHGTGMSRRSPSKGGSRAPQLSTRTR